jgi:hypothetical protein
MRQIQLYIEGQKVELFQDEQINVTSSVQNISDISKVFTDFSQSFTVPASTVNNRIFQHFYQTDVGDPSTPGTTFDANIRRNAVLEIDLTTFRRGKISIEKANVKNGMPENYQITFYGEIRALKDLFGEDKLFNLDLSAYEFQFTAAEIYDRITDLTTDYDVRYPLIASDRLWQYRQGPENVANNSHAIEYDELFPAIKVSKLFEAIENDYGVTFTGTFLSDPRFTQVFLYGKNTIEYNWISEQSPIPLSAITYNLVAGLNNYNASNYVDLVNDSINIEFLNQITFHIISINVISKSSAGTFYIDVFQDGNLFQTITGTTVGVLPNIGIQNTVGLNSKITFKVKADAIMDLDFTITYELPGVFDDPITGQPTYQTNYCVISTPVVSLSGNVNFNNVLPDMKISDFFAGVLKEFNATCVGTDVNTFEILPLEDWYGQGALVDITEYTDIDSIDIERIKLYKKIAFKYQPSESFANKNYFRTYSQQYGDVEYQYTYDGEEYVVESPFENLLFQRSTHSSGSYAIFGYALNDNFQAYTPKPILLYLYGESNNLGMHPIKFYTGSTHLDITSYALFGQDLTYQNTKYSLNFGADNSIIHLETIQQGLFAEYYSAYLFSLFNLKNRLVNVKTNLPVSLLTNLQLNDRVIIRDKRYIINEMKSNLTTGQVDFSLYLDFRPITSGKPFVPSFDAQCINVPINLVNKSVSATITTDFVGVTITPSTITSSQNVVVCIPENLNTTSNILAENTDDIITEEFQNLITEESSVQVIILTITYTLSDGTQVANQITILQQ